MRFAKLFGVPRGPRVVVVGAPHHVVQRGNNRQKTFFCDGDCRDYLQLIRKIAERNRMRLLGYCLMPNHVHLIVIPDLLTSLSRGVGQTHNLYSRRLNHRLGRTGHLWERRFYSAPMDRYHLIAGLLYVDMNPVRASLTGEPSEFEWSSAAAHVTGRDPTGLLDMDAWKDLNPLGDWADALVGSDPDTALAARIREATYSGRPLGSDAFLDHLERETGLQTRRKKRGRPKREGNSRAAAA